MTRCQNTECFFECIPGPGVVTQSFPGLQHLLLSGCGEGGEIRKLFRPSFEIKNLVYTIEKGYITAEEAKEKKYQIMKLSGTEFRKKLRNGDSIPEWFAFKSVVDVLRKS